MDAVKENKDTYEQDHPEIYHKGVQEKSKPYEYPKTKIYVMEWELSIGYAVLSISNKSHKMQMFDITTGVTDEEVSEYNSITFHSQDKAIQFKRMLQATGILEGADVDQMNAYRGTSNYSPVIYTETEIDGSLDHAVGKLEI